MNENGSAAKLSAEALNAVAENLSDALFFAPEELRLRLLAVIERETPELAQMIKEKIIFL